MSPLAPPQDDLISESSDSSVSSVATYTTCADTFDEGFHLTDLTPDNPNPSVASPRIIDVTYLAPGEPIDSATVPSIIALPSASVAESVSAGDISIDSPMPEPEETDPDNSEDRVAYTTTTRGRRVYTPSRFGTFAATVPHSYSMYNYQDETDSIYPLIGETGVQSCLTGKNSKYSLASTN